MMLGRNRDILHPGVDNEVGDFISVEVFRFELVSQLGVFGYGNRWIVL